jgi:hypothetical protein
MTCWQGPAAALLAFQEVKTFHRIANPTPPHQVAKGRYREESGFDLRRPFQFMQATLSSERRVWPFLRILDLTRRQGHPEEPYMVAAITVPPNGGLLNSNYETWIFSGPTRNGMLN